MSGLRAGDPVSWKLDEPGSVRTFGTFHGRGGGKAIVRETDENGEHHFRTVPAGVVSKECG